MPGEAFLEPNDPMPYPQTIVDAGGETMAILMAAVRRRMDELAPGQVLEILSLEPGAPVEIAMWCRMTGHKLIRLQEDGEKTHFWIRKG